MIMAASCFARSSPRFEQWVLDLPGIGPSVAAYRRGEGMPLRAKVLALAMMTVAVIFAAGFVIQPLPVRLVVVAAGLLGWWYLLVRVPTSETVT